MALTMSLPLLADVNEFPANPPSAVHLSKKVTQEGDVNHQYTITLESYVTGKTIITERSVPCDIVLVLDVSGSMDDKVTTYTYTQSTRTTLTYSQADNTTYYFKDGESYYPIQTERTGQIGNRRYHLYYTKNNQKYYFLPDGNISTTRGNGVTNDGTTIFTSTHGTLYTRSSSSQSKIGTLKEATTAFINTVAAKAAEDGVNHRISIVKYADDEYYGSQNSVAEGDHRNWGDNYTEVVKNLTDVSVAGNASSLTTAVNSLKAGGATSADYGLYKASLIFDTTINNYQSTYTYTDKTGATRTGNRNKVVVLFTDGEPNHGSGFDSYVAGTAINTSKTLKDDGIIVYTVGVFGSSVGGDVDTYMSYVSSNYPNAYADNFNTSYWEDTSDMHPGDDGSDQGYYQRSDGSDLTSIFVTIADNSAAASYNLTQTSAVVLDVMSSYFRLPSGTQAEDITAYESKFKGIEGGDTIWAKPGEEGYTELTVGGQGDGKNLTVVIGGEDGKDVSVTGFDFATNFVGDHPKTSGGTEPGGSKLIIKIPIEVDPDNVGGADLFTNDPRSGIYVEDPDNPGQLIPLVAFYQPTVSLPNIIIRAFGLEVGESASFTIYRIPTKVDQVYEDGTYTYDTYDDTKIDPDFVPIHVIVTHYPGISSVSAKVKLNDEGRYKVVCDSWSYTYDVSVHGAEGYTHDSDSHRFTANDGGGIVYETTTKPVKGTDDDGQPTSEVQGNYIIRTVCLGTQSEVNDDPSRAANKYYGKGTPFDFVFTKGANIPETHIDEDFIKNWSIPLTEEEGNGGVTPEEEEEEEEE